MSDMPRFTTIAQIGQLAAAVCSSIIAGVVGWYQIRGHEPLSAALILLLVAALVILIVVLLLYPRFRIVDPVPPKVPDVTVNPFSKVITKTKDGVRHFEVEGTLKDLPAELEIWAFVKDRSQPKWWPHGPAIVNGSNWIIPKVNPGASDQIRLQIRLVGRSGQALIGYYHLTGNVMNQLKAKVLESAPSVEPGDFRAPAIADLGSDMAPVLDKVVDVV